MAKNDLKKYAGKKVAVAMSGGVDSSVAALLLKKAKADVFGVTMDTGLNSKDINEAKNMARELGIKHYVIDVSEIFNREVVGYFIRESMNGRNPNPCVPCNQKIKFGALIEGAEKLGADFFATGHYARFENRKLKRPKDVKKDQSYVLGMLPKEVFKKLIFPIGGFTKDQVRKIAKKNKLSNHAKPGNADLCFLDVEKGEFVRLHAKSAGSGNIVDLKGNVLGQHTGIENYTIGQRRGLGLKNQVPLYVVDVISEKNVIVVGGKEDLFAKHFYVSNANWISIDAPKKPMDVDVLVRNKAEPQKAKISVVGKRVKVTPAKPIWAVSPGQIAVFLKKDVVLGAGWID